MQGYYGRPKESAACFIRNPFAAGREEKLYCTGDWVTLDEKGNYLFVGRKDHMIKTRGYRVELGEIETVMVAHPAVEEAVALAIPDDEIGNTIRAIVTLSDSRSVTSPELKRHCAEKLPPYMVPEGSSFVTHCPEPAPGRLIDNGYFAKGLRQRRKIRSAQQPKSPLRDLRLFHFSPRTDSTWI